MNTKHTSKNDAVKVSRRAMLGKSAKYAALIPAASLIVTKANAHQLTGSNAECKLSQPANHCDSQHADQPPV